MTAVLLDDHLLRDWLAGPDPALRRAVARSAVATTNFWYARLCKSAAGGQSGAALLGSWSAEEREALIAAIIALPEDIEIVEMKELAWRMGRLVHDHSALSTLGSEAVSAAEHLGASILVSSRDDGPGIRRTCSSLRIRYRTLDR